MTEETIPSLAEVLETAVHFNQLDNYRHKHIVVLSDEEDLRIFEKMRTLATDFSHYVTLLELADSLKVPSSVVLDAFENGVAAAETPNEIFNDLCYILQDAVPQEAFDAAYLKARDRALTLATSIRIAMDVYWESRRVDEPDAYRFFEKALEFVSDIASAEELAGHFDGCDIWRVRKELQALFLKTVALNLSLEHEEQDES